MDAFPGFLSSPGGLAALAPHFLHLLGYLVLVAILIPLAARYLVPSQQTRPREHGTMHPIPRVINRRGRLGRFPVAPLGPDDDEGQSSESPATPTAEQAEFDPSLADVATVQAELMAKGNLPVEIVNIILDKAEYWACTSATADYSNLPRKSLDLRGGHNENQFLLRTKPLALAWSPRNEDAWRDQAVPRRLQEEYSKEQLQNFMDEPKTTILHPVRKVVFNITSSDQGWGGDHNDHGTYHNSWTWFDAGLERFDAKAECNANCPGKTEDPEKPNLCTCAIRPVWPSIISEGEDEAVTRYHHPLHPTPEFKIQCNKLAVQGMQRHKVEWRHNDNTHPDSTDATQLYEAGRGRATGTGEFVRNLQVGDIVTVWGRARFGGWQNRIKKVEVKVYWAI